MVVLTCQTHGERYFSYEECPKCKANSFLIEEILNANQIADSLEGSKALAKLQQKAREENGFSEEGVKYDQEKERLDLIPFEAIFALGKVLTYGAQKYTNRNWEKGMDWGRLFGAAMRHLWCWWGGKGPTSKS